AWPASPHRPRPALKARPRCRADAPQALLARPDDAGHPVYLGGLYRAVRVGGVERDELDGARVAAGKNLGRHLACRGPDHNPVALAHRRSRLDDQDVAVAIEGQHGIALHLQRIGAFAALRREFDLIPSLPGRKARIVEIAAGARLRET